MGIIKYIKNSGTKKLVTRQGISHLRYTTKNTKHSMIHSPNDAINFIIKRTLISV